MIVAFAIIAAALAGVPGERQERQAVISTYNGLVSPLAYGASPYVSSVYSGVPAISTYSSLPAISTYSSYPTAYTGYNGVYGGVPAVRYY